MLDTSRKCAGCETIIPAGLNKGAPRKWCSGSCRVRAYRELSGYKSPPKVRLPHPPRFCPVCSTEIDPMAHGKRRYCSRKCSAWHHDNLNTNRCSEPDCHNPVKVRGLCQNHDRKINGRKSRAGAFPTVERECVSCGAPVQQNARNAKLGLRPTCSFECRREMQYGPRKPKPPKWEPVAQDCPWCGDEFLPKSRNMTRCSKRCTAAARAHRKALRYGEFSVSLSVRKGIYERDGWTCQICLEAIDLEADPCTDWAPSLDHIVPQSQGGSHESSNLRTAHFWCNAALSDGRYVSDADLRAPVSA